MDHVASNPYATPEIIELRMPEETRFVCPILSAFLWRGLYAAMLILPFNAAYQFLQHEVGINYVGPRAYVAISSIAGIGFVAVGDGLTAMLCWQILRRRDRLLTVFVVSAGLRVLSVLCQYVCFLGVGSSPDAVWRLLLVSLHYGPPPVLISLLIMRLLNRHICWWGYLTVYVGASTPAAVPQSIIVMAFAGLFRSVYAAAIASQLLNQTCWPCVLAAAIWFTIRLSRPSITRSA